MKFSDMKYTRPDIEKIGEEIKKIVERIENAKCFDDVDRAFMDFCDISSDIETDISLAYVRHSIDTKDEFYDKENDYADEISPQISEFANSVNMALFNSPFRADFSAKYGDILIKNIEIELKAFSPETVSDKQE